MISAALVITAGVVLIIDHAQETIELLQPRLIFKLTNEDVHNRPICMLESLFPENRVIFHFQH